VNRKALKVRPNPSRPFRGTSGAEGQIGKQTGNQLDVGAFQLVGETGDTTAPEVYQGDGDAVDGTRLNSGSAPGSRKWLAMQCALGLMIAGAILLSACGKGATLVPSTETIVSFTQVPPSPFPIGGQAQLIATVANDPSQMGVNWSVSCQSSSCGSFTPTHTLSGLPTFYTAPNAVPPGNTVNITATSVYNPSQHVTVTIVLTVSTQTVGITFTQAPPGTVQTNSQTMITATVTNDPTNAGVTWMLSCAGGSDCGEFNEQQTQSGQPVTYTAPPTPPGGGGLVNIIAVATADPTVSVTAQTQVVSNSLSITFNPTPPTTLAVNATSPITAVVTNDPLNLGVDWSVTCGSADCGSFNPTNTASGSPTTYTAPATVPAGNNVTVKASAAANPQVNVTAVIQITSSTNLLGLLNGQYAISFSGTDGNGFYGATGSIIADGMGNITSGEEDFVDLGATGFAGAVGLVGTYSIGQDGRGTMYLCNLQNLGINQSDGCPNQTYYEQVISFAVVNSSHSLVIEFDYGATSHGSIDFQTPADFTLGSISGGYSFTFTGIDDSNSPVPAALGGVFTADGNGNFNGVEDINDNGTVKADNSFVGMASGPPDGFGRATACFPSDCSVYAFSFYIVNTGQLNFLETDFNPFISAGAAFAQGSGTFSGAYGFTGAGWVKKDARAIGGVFTASGGSLSGGVIDVNDAGSSAVLGATLTGSYSIGSNGRGTMTLSCSPACGVTSLAVYITQSQGVLLLELDKGALSSGAALTNTAGSAFNGNYAAYYESHPPTNVQTDVVGQIIADDTKSLLSGTADVNQFSFTTPIETPAVPFTGSFTANSDGRFTGDLISGTTGSLSEIFYVLNSSTVLMLESDISPAIGLFELQDLTVPERK
jgi:hypothetical protein